VDIATLIGIVLSFGLMVWAILMGGPLSIFVDIPSVAIVIGGSIGVALINFPLGDILGTVGVVKKTILIKEPDTNKLIAQMLDFSAKARKGGILSLQDQIDSIEDKFLVKALQMAVDGQEPSELKAILTTEIDNLAARHSYGSEILNTLGAIGPAMGMIGTLIGLVQMLQNMSDPAAIGPAMAVALLTTFYGAVLANILFIPMAGKLKARSKTEVLQKMVIVEGMESILSGENPRVMEQRLHTYLAPKKRTSVFN
jgi:chemotaxis protein MotA